MFSGFRHKQNGSKRSLPYIGRCCSSLPGGMIELRKRPKRYNLAILTVEFFQVRVSRVACALAKKGYNVSPQWLVNGSSAGRDGKGKERGLGSRPRLSPDLGEVSCALLASSVVCLCISSSFVGCTGRPHPPQDFIHACFHFPIKYMHGMGLSVSP